MERRILRDLETRMNRARRAAQRAADAGLVQARDRFLATRKQLNERLIEFARSRQIEHVPTWDVGEVITGADMRAPEVDALTHLRGIDGTTILRADAKAIEDVLATAQAELDAVLRDYPADIEGVPDLDAMLQAAGAPASAFGGDLTRALQSGEGPAWNVHEAVIQGAELPRAEGEQVYNLVGRSSAASMQSLLDAVRLLRTAEHAVEIGPLDEGWPDLVAAAGWWLRGPGRAVTGFLGALRPVMSQRGLEAAPWQEVGG